MQPDSNQPNQPNQPNEVSERQRMQHEEEKEGGLSKFYSIAAVVIFIAAIGFIAYGRISDQLSLLVTVNAQVVDTSTSMSRRGGSSINATFLAEGQPETISFQGGFFRNPISSGNSMDSEIVRDRVQGQLTDRYGRFITIEAGTVEAVQETPYVDEFEENYTSDTSNAPENLLEYPIEDRSDRSMDGSAAIDLNGLLKLADVNWHDLPETSYILNAMIADGVDHKTLGLVLLEDLLEVLDDYDGTILFEELWEQALSWRWANWRQHSTLQFIGNGSSGSVPNSQRNLSEFSDYISYVYSLTSVNWDTLQMSSSILDALISAGIDHKTIALIMIDDFLEFIDTNDGVSVFDDLWVQVLTDDWSINSPLQYTP